MDIITHKSTCLSQLAALFKYPTAEYLSQCEHCASALKQIDGKAAADLRRFHAWLLECTQEQVEDAYTRTFDLSPLCTPYASIHLFGEESYKRGALMEKLIERYRELEIAYERELPDHVSNLLQYLDQGDRDERAEIYRHLLNKPLSNMEERLSQKKNSFVYLVSAARRAAELHSGKEVTNA